MRAIRRTFLAGLLVVLPLSVTVWVLWLLVTTLDRVGDLVPDPYHPEVLLGRELPGIGILLAVTAILVVGVVAENFVGRRLVMLYEAVLGRVPVVSAVYATVKQVLSQLTTSDRGFERVVLVQWPRDHLWAVGFVTGGAFVDVEGKERMVNVFLPTTPNPTSGFYFMVAEADVIPTDMTIEEAFQLIMSAGIVEPRRVAIATTEDGPP